MTAPDETADTNANAPAVAALICTAPTCGHRGQHVQIHADTILPVHCGGCFAVLHCEHTEETSTDGPTLADPLVHTVTRCTACGSETAHDTRDATDAELAALLPPGLRAALQRLG